MTKHRHKEVPLIDAQETNIVDSLNKRIRELQEEVNRYKVNEKAVADHSRGVTDNAEHAALMKELRKLRGVEQKNLQLKQDN